MPPLREMFIPYQLAPGDKGGRPNPALSPEDVRASNHQTERCFQTEEPSPFVKEDLAEEDPYFGDIGNLQPGDHLPEEVG